MNLLKFKRKLNDSDLRKRKTISLIGKTIDFDWMSLVSFVFLVLILGLIFSWNLYKTIEDKSFINEEDVLQKSSLKINTQQLERVTDDLQKKKDTFESLTGGMILSDSIKTATTTE